MKKVKKIIKRIIIFIFIIAVIAAVIFCVVIRKNTYRFIKVKDYDGKVSISRNDEKERATKGQLLINGDEVSVPEDGLLELLVDKDKHIVASPNTEFMVVASGFSFNGKVSIEVTKGEALFTIDNKLGKNSEFEVTTPNASFSVRGTTFSVNYDEDDNRAELQVIEGTVAVNNGEEEYVAEAGAKVIVDDEGIKDLSNISKADVGDHVFFGSYEQDGDEENGKEDIEWIVLDKDDSSSLLISAYGLDAMPFCYEEELTTSWEDSYVREWLNDDFYSEAFDEIQADKILLNETANTVTEWDYETVFTDAENTKDHVFLLSGEEFINYFEINNIHSDLGYTHYYSQAALCEPVQKLINEERVGTVYNDGIIYEEYGYTDDMIGTTTGAWWLRTTSKSLIGTNISVWNVNVYGVTGDNTISGISSDVMVRPVIRVEIDD